MGSSIPDEEFAATGATMVADPDDVWADADMVLGVKEPIAEEYPLLGLRPARFSSPTSTWPPRGPAPRP